MRCYNSDNSRDAVRAVDITDTATVGAPAAGIRGRLAEFTAGETVFGPGHHRGQGPAQSVICIVLLVALDIYRDQAAPAAFQIDRNIYIYIYMCTGYKIANIYNI